MQEIGLSSGAFDLALLPRFAYLVVVSLLAVDGIAESPSSSCAPWFRQGSMAGQGRLRDYETCRYSHYDVVAAGKGWSTDPWKMVAKDGYFYGRGVSDNKGTQT